MFGRSEFQTGIIIEPVAAKAFDPKDLNKLAEFRNEIWLVALLLQRKMLPIPIRVKVCR